MPWRTGTLAYWCLDVLAPWRIGALRIGALAPPRRFGAPYKSRCGKKTFTLATPTQDTSLVLSQVLFRPQWVRAWASYNCQREALQRMYIGHTLQQNIFRGLFRGHFKRMEYIFRRIW